MVPNRLAGLLVEAVKLACRARGEDQLADDQRRGVRTWPVRHIVLFREGRLVAVFPEGLAARGIQSDDNLLLAFAMHGEKPSALNCNAREAFTQLTAP